MIFDDESLEGASISAERVRLSVEALGREHVHSGSNCLTVSIGVAASVDPQEHWESVLKRADEALYQAKHKGKNRTEINSPTAEELPQAVNYKAG